MSSSSGDPIDRRRGSGRDVASADPDARGASNPIGEPLPRFEDAPLVSGSGRYVYDIHVPGCLEAVFVRSPMAHALLRGVDLEEARRTPGVVGAFAVADLAGLPSTPAPPIPGVPDEMRRPALAVDRVRFAGEAIAVVVAEGRAQAEDAAETVALDLDPLPVVLDPNEAAGEDAIRLFDGVGNVAIEETLGEPAAENLANAAVVVELEIRNARLAPASIEPRAVLVRPEAEGSLTVWCSHQAPHRLRDALARAFGLQAAEVRVIVPNVGGAFGAKSQTYPEYVVVAHLARTLGRPVRWIEERRESFLAAAQGRGQNQRLRLEADEQGRLLALDVEIDADLGAYPQIGALVPTFTAWVLSGPYRIPRIRVRVRGVVTNAPPTAPYRGAGRPEAAFLLERAMDELARRLDLDPAELRHRNFIAPEDFPYRSPTGAIYDSGRYAEALDEALRLADYPGVREEQRRRREKGDQTLLGVGIASFVERTGGQAGSSEFGGVEVAGGGEIVARSGSSSHGQGHGTAFAQVVASVLDVEPASVRVVQGDTAEVREGTGTFASRSMQMGGSALHAAATRVLDDARSRAAEILEVAREDLEYVGGSFAIVGSPAHCVSLASIVERTGPLHAEELFEAPQAFPFGSYVAVVEIDPATGEVHVRKVVAVDDSGVIVNPLIVHGQTVGSVVQGLGQALLEEMAFDENGQPLAGSFMDYLVPSATEVPEVIVGATVTPNPNSPLGVKGAGEEGCIGTPPAVVNAVVDALAGHATAGLQMPITPEKVWRILREGRR